MNDYICFDCRHIFSGQLSCPCCGSEEFAPMEDHTDEHLFVGSTTETFTGDQDYGYQTNQIENRELQGN